MPTVVDLGELGSLGFVIEGDTEFDSAGASVSGAGDVNGDGFDDFIVGAPFNDAGGTDAGAAYVIFGKATGLGAFDLTDLQPSQGFKIQGDEAGDWAGWTVSAAGDVNGDGFDDIIVGAAYYGYYASTAHAYVIFGKASGFGTIDLTGLPASSGFVLTDQISAFSTFNVAGAGDVNGDGFDDVIIGSSYDNDTAGAAYVIFGKASGFGPIDLATLAPSVGFEIIGDAVDDQVGHSVAAAGDINGDGFDDLIIGAPPGFYGVGSGAEAYVIFGQATLTTIDLTNLTATQGFAIQGDDSAGKWAGATVSGAGDFNGDGFDDIVVAAKSGSLGGTDAGQAYVIFGKASGFGAVDLANLGAAGFIIQGDMAGDWFAASLSAAGDVNGDGFDDLIIGATYGDNGAQHAGEAYVIFGKASGFGTIDLSNFTAADGFIIEGDAADARVASSVAGAGDINGDGFADLLIGNPLAFHGINVEGRVYVIFGAGTFDDDAENDFNGDGRSDILWRNEAGSMSQWLGQVDGTFAYNPNAAYQLPTNWDAAASGDFNGDGRDDIMWRNELGAMSEWLGQTNGTFAYNPNAAYQLPTNWDVGATGDFNGDGRDDIIWRNEVGALSEWLGQSDGAFAYNPNAAYSLPTNWALAATGDFNGDGRDDILWRNEVGAMSQWLANADGTFAYNANAAYSLPTNWELAATGDFNGDGRDDIIWRNEVGAMAQWLANADATFAYNPNATYQLPTNWDVATTGDFNGDGRDDILWRNEVGAMSQWLGQSDGTFAYNPNAAYQLPTNWQNYDLIP